VSNPRSTKYIRAFGAPIAVIALMFFLRWVSQRLNLRMQPVFERASHIVVNWLSRLWEAIPGSVLACAIVGTFIFLALRAGSRAE
jgi:hypothetical protein